MDELREVADLIGKLPALATWVLIGLWAYKAIVVGSIYGVIRLAIVKGHDLFAQPRRVEYRFNGNPLNDSVKALLDAQLARIGNGTYLHTSDVLALSKAIDSMNASHRSS